MEPVISTVSESNSLTHWVVDRSVNFLETRDTSRPFFLWTSFTKPHPPFDCDIRYWNLYQNRTVPNPIYGDWSQRPEDVPEGFMRFIRSLNSCDRFSPETLRVSDLTARAQSLWAQHASSPIGQALRGH
jgi:hypothetical protein